ncbi:MAG: hypothetical protein SRB1_02445 [Desulfobacteraceae bacterium Eth-SRB1]|nr:MAG: hypothetical protein SRB1_02445 [Desulfobacteraceae bacterium Eth-SRB1]
MEANRFIAEVYRRMALRHGTKQARPNWSEIKDDPSVINAVQCYKTLLPTDKDAAILDIGFGNGWFMATCVILGYTNISGAEFQVDSKNHIKEWSPSIVALHDIKTNIGNFLANQPEKYDFIRMSHVIEHIPKHSLFYIVDALYFALKRKGTLLIRCPNMEGPCAMSSMYVTLGHEYGFTISNLESLLSLCNFEDIEFHRFMHRLFRASQENQRKQFSTELIVTTRRIDLRPLFNKNYA